MKQKLNINDMIYQYQNDVCYLKRMEVLSLSSYEKNYYIDRMNQRTEDIILELNQFMVNTQETNSDPNEQKEFTIEDLSNFDGSNGKPAYVAVNGDVYDMSTELRWAGGTHFGLYAGNDLSMEFLGCHQGMIEILEKLPKVGTLKK